MSHCILGRCWTRPELGVLASFSFAMFILAAVVYVCSPLRCAYDISGLAFALSS